MELENCHKKTEHNRSYKETDTNHIPGVSIKMKTNIGF
jgi:hypothetical protein